MKLRLFAVIAATAALTMSCKEVVNVIGNIGGDAVEASGPSVTQQRAITPINELNVSSGISVVFVQSPDLKLTVEAPENIQPCISTEIKNGELTVKPNKSFRGNSSKILVTVMAPSVTDFDVSSGASLTIKGNYSQPDAKTEFDVSSGASFSMESLAASSAEIEISSGASASVGNINVTGLKASASSGASLGLSGRADVADLNASGGASISASNLVAESGSASAGGGASISSNIRNASVHSGGGGSVRNH